MDDRTTTLADLRNEVQAFVDERDWRQSHNSKNFAIPDLDGIVGPSPGSGLSPNLVETDLSSQTNCGPEFPPYAYGDSESTNVNTLRNVTRTAFDYDGDAIDRVITALPLHDKLFDPIAGGTIVGTPYTLAGGGNVVRYTPVPAYGGADYFQFKANDGGTPTTGGDSNSATVSIVLNMLDATEFVNLLLNITVP